MSESVLVFLVPVRLWLESLEIDWRELTMSILGKLMDTMRLNPEEEGEDYYLDDDFEDEPPKKSFFSRKNTADDEEYYDEPQDKSRFLGRPTPKVVPMRRSGMEVTMVKPTSMDSSKDICNYLLSGKAVVLNMEGIHMEVAQRIIDFVSGAAYSMDGNLQRISNYIFIVTPNSVELSGDFQDMLAAGDVSGMEMAGMTIHI